MRAVGQSLGVGDGVPLPNGTRGSSGEPSKRVQESRLSYSTASKPLRAQVSIIGWTQAAARRRLAALRMSTRYSPPHSGSSPSARSTSFRGQFERSSGRSTPDASSWVWKALT